MGLESYCPMAQSLRRDQRGAATAEGIEKQTPCGIRAMPGYEFWRKTSDEIEPSMNGMAIGSCVRRELVTGYGGEMRPVVDPR